MRMEGSLINRLMEGAKQPDPEVGMGVTRCSYTDRDAYTVIQVISSKEIVVQEDKATRTDNNGMSESQTYAFERDPKGRTIHVTKRKDGRWVEKGQPIDGVGYALGRREKYHDFSF